mgnify:CR=1 FL=1
MLQKNLVKQRECFLNWWCDLRNKGAFAAAAEEIARTTTATEVKTALTETLAIREPFYVVLLSQQCTVTMGLPRHCIVVVEGGGARKNLTTTTMQ